MKTAVSVSTSVSASGAKRRPGSPPARVACWGIALLAVWLGAADWREYTVSDVRLVAERDRAWITQSEFRPLVVLRRGDPFDFKKVRVSMDNLYRTGAFANIEVRVEPLPPPTATAGAAALPSVIVHFRLTRKYVTRRISYIARAPLKRKTLARAVRSMQVNDTFEDAKVSLVGSELRTFLRTQGYFNPVIEPQVRLNEKKMTAAVAFVIQPGPTTRLRSVTVRVDPQAMTPVVQPLLGGDSAYVPARFEKRLDKVRTVLRQHRYFAPRIEVSEHPDAQDPGIIDLTVNVSCRERYIYKFVGMAEKKEIISSIWEKEVFEKWAKEESEARILNYLKNEGYLNAAVRCNIVEKDAVKYIYFIAETGKRYNLGKVDIAGNHFISEKKIREVISTDDLVFERMFWLRASSLIVDLEVLKYYYYYQGFPEARISVEPTYEGGHVDIRFVIQEGRRYSVTAVAFNGNRHFAGEALMARMKTRPGLPFVQRQLNEDLGALQNFYWNSGFADATVEPEIGPGQEKSVLIRIREGEPQWMGELVVIGASGSQGKLLRNLFPIAPGEPFSQAKVDDFRDQVEKSAIFSEFHVEKIPALSGRVNVLIRVIPDRSRFYGIGLGWEERLGLRGTIEYQERNMLRSASSLSAILQLGLNERRGIVSIDTPFFLRQKISSSFKVWEENEAYPSYQFNRFGVGGSLIKKFSENLYLISSLKWYRTTLTELSIPEYGVDKLHVPFATTALSFSVVRENRDDALNPSRGDFLSADLKLGLPLFEKNYTFLKFFWSYQKHYPIRKHGVLSFSLRNGVGFGDMSITERFFGGGSHSFRGTRNDRLGSLYTPTSSGDTNNYPLGGNAMILFNLEATFPVSVIPVPDLYYSLFADMGNIYWKSSDFNLDKMERAVGFGLKYRTAMGPLRIDFAWNLRRTGEKRFLIQIGVGNAF